MCVTPSPESTTTPELRPGRPRGACQPGRLGKAGSISARRTLGIQGQHRLDRHVDAAEAVALEHDLAHLLAVLERVHGRLRQQDLAALGVRLHLLVEGVVPEVLHVVPLLHDAVLHRVADLEHSAGGGGLVAAHDVLDDHIVDLLRGALLLGPQDRPADDGRVLEFGEVLGGVADLEETGAAVEDWRAVSSNNTGRGRNAAAAGAGVATGADAPMGGAVMVAVGGGGVE